MIGPGVVGAVASIPEEGVGIASTPVAQLPLSGAEPFATDPSQLRSSAGDHIQRTRRVFGYMRLTACPLCLLV
jgi:hypothetical protein